MKLYERMQAILAIRDLRAAYRMVLVCLACHANREMRAWPSVATIAAEVGADQGTVRRALKVLREKGYIDGQFSEGGRTHRLTVHLEPLQNACVEGGSTHAKCRGPEALDHSCRTQVKPLQNAGETPAGCTGNYSRTVQEQIYPPSAGAKGAAPRAMRWTEAIYSLTSAGESERAARGLIAMLCKSYGDEVVEGAVARMLAEAPIDPAAWLVAAARAAGPNGANTAQHYIAEAERIERQFGIPREDLF